MVMVRLSGKRTVGQFTPFDLLVVMLLSESVSNSLSGGDNTLEGGRGRDPRRHRGTARPGRGRQNFIGRNKCERWGQVRT
jgi:hypothetical protein